MKREIIRTSGAPDPIGPYNQAIKAGNMVYCSGQISPGAENLGAETHGVMKNLQAVLAEAGSSFDQVVKTTIFFISEKPNFDMERFGVINEAYGTYFKEGNAPARETVQVDALPKDVNVEISMMAICD